MSFRLWTIFYVFSLFAAAMATFGAWGILIASIALGAWVSLSHDPPNISAAALLVVILIAWFFGMLLGPAFDVGMREAARRNQCLSQIKQLALGILNYESGRRRFPPAHVAAPDGSPLLSWRAVVYPGMFLYQFDFVDQSKAWNDPANRKYSASPLEEFQCPSYMLLEATTDYFAVVGPNTMWPGLSSRRDSEITDDKEQTIILIESHGRNVNWAEPRDLTFDEAVELLSTPASAEHGHPVEDGFFYKRGFGRCVAFADGHAEFIPGPLSRELAAALLTVDGGEDLSQLNLADISRPELDYAKCYGFGLFVVLAVLPVVRLRQRKTLDVKGDSRDATHRRSGGA
jgi:hypothetical protein